MGSYLLNLALLFSVTEAYKILICYPVPVKSLNILGEGHVRPLLEAGHEVTYITVFPLKKELKNLRQIDVSSNMKVFANDDNLNMSRIIENSPIKSDILYLQEIALKIAIATFQHKDVRELLEDPKEKYDAIIVDLFETEIYAGLSALYSCPMIWSYSMGPSWQVLRLIDEPSNPAYAPDYLSKNLPPFSFLQRIEELWTRIQWSLMKRFIAMPKEKAVYEDIFRDLIAQRGKPLPDYEELIFNVSLILGNEHHAIGGTVQTPQNFKLVGGYHIENQPKSLPKDLQTLMDNAEYGVIYFSMGSTWQSKDMPNKLIRELLKTFGELKQTVIWKYEEELTNVPTNVHITKWAPQTSILAHRNCLFFISHGGLLSSTEAIHFGVPVIGIPVYFDQFININKAVSRGYAIQVDLNYELATNLKAAIVKMLGDKKYKENVKMLSEIYHDRPVAPSKELVHWVEHVVRTRGAPHLRSPALLVPWYQKLYLDLLAIILLVLFLVYKIASKILKTMIKKVHIKRD